MVRHASEDLEEAITKLLDDYKAINFKVYTSRRSANLHFTVIQRRISGRTTRKIGLLAVNVAQHVTKDNRRPPQVRISNLVVYACFWFEGAL